MDDLVGHGNTGISNMVRRLVVVANNFGHNQDVYNDYVSGGSH
jgi:hypothetical protein